MPRYDALKPMIGGTLNIKHIRAHWDEILRLATSIKQGTVTASLMLRKLGSYPRQNGLAVAAARAGPHRAHAVHPGLAAKRRAAPPRACRTEQGRGAQRAGPGRVLQPAGRNPRPQLRAAALPRQRPQPGERRPSCGTRSIWNAPSPRSARRARGRSLLATAPLSRGLGAHQSDRRLHLAAEQAVEQGNSGRCDQRGALACFIVRFVRRPLVARKSRRPLSGLPCSGDCRAMSINLTVVRGVRCSTELRYIAGHRACSCFQLVDFVCCDLCDKSRKQLGYASEQLSRPSCQYVPEQGRTRVQANLFAATHEARSHEH